MKNSNKCIDVTIVQGMFKQHCPLLCNIALFRGTALSDNIPANYSKYTVLQNTLTIVTEKFGKIIVARSICSICRGYKNAKMM